MYIEVQSHREQLGPIELLDADNFREFKVVVVGDADPEPALDTIGVSDGAGHVFVERAALERLAGARASDPQWTAGVDAMIAYAAEQGWVDGAGRVRAHVEEPPLG